MKYIIDKNNEICHIVITPKDWKNLQGRNDIIPPINPLQLALIPMNCQQSFPNHLHLPCEKKVKTTQESWIVLRGAVEVVYGDGDGKKLEVVRLYEGYIGITLKGSHHYTSLQDFTVVAEFKTGPYLGQEKDKTIL